jgi:hypothetical protein
MAKHDVVAAGVLVVKHSEVPKLEVADVPEDGRELGLGTFAAKIITFLSTIAIPENDNLIFEQLFI